MSQEYLYEKFHIAVEVLVSGKGTIKERLENAFISALLVLDPSDVNSLPQDVVSSYKAFEARLFSGIQERNESQMTASLKEISDEDASRFAGHVFRIYFALARELAQENPELLF